MLLFVGSEEAESNLGFQAVWPDLAKFCQFFKHLEIFSNILKVYLIFGKVCEPTLGRFVCFWSKIHHCKWPNNKKTIWPSGHTAHLVHHNNYPHSVATSLHHPIIIETNAWTRKRKCFRVLPSLLMGLFLFSIMGRPILQSVMDNLNNVNDDNVKGNRRPSLFCLQRRWQRRRCW